VPEPRMQNLISAERINAVHYVARIKPMRIESCTDPARTFTQHQSVRAVYIVTIKMKNPRE